MKPNLKEDKEHSVMGKKYISEEYLLGALNNIHSCRDILPGCGGSVYCFGCR